MSTIIDAWLLDSKVAVRALRRQKLFAAGVVATLALAIGSLSAVSALVYRVLLEPLPFPRAEELTLLYEGNKQQSVHGNDLAPGTCAAFLRMQAFAQGGCWMRAENVLGSGGEAERLPGLRVSSGVFSTLGIQPQRGRLFREEEMSEGRDQVAVLTHEVWQSRFGGKRDIIGAQIELNGRNFEVIGVLPPGFRLQKEAVQIYTPLALSASNWADQRHSYLGGIARLRPGVSIERAQAEAKRVAGELETRFPADNQNLRLDVLGMQADLTEKVKGPLWLLWGTACLLALLAAMNVSHLLLTRGMDRVGEMQLRSSLGATQARIWQQCLSESLLLALLGGAAGIALASVSFRALRLLIPPALSAYRDVGLDGVTLGIAFAVSLLVSVAMGSIPAWKSAESSRLRSGLQRGTASDGGWGSRCFLAAQVAMAAMLLVSAGLFVRSWDGVGKTAMGMQIEGVATGQVLLSPFLQNNEKRWEFYEEVVQKLQAQPGMQSAAFTSAAPLTWRGGNHGFRLEGDACETMSCVALYREVTPQYWSTMGIPLRQGRFLEKRDDENGEKVVVINESLARIFFGGKEAIGQRMRFSEQGEEWRRIVGIVADTKDMGLEAAARQMVYVPYRQSTLSFAVPSMLVVKSKGEVGAAFATMRRVLASTQPSHAIAELRSMEELVAREREVRALESGLTSFFGVAALLLSAIGLYGVLSYRVARRRREFGIRLALGASNLALGLTLTRDAILTCSAGLVLGLAGGASIGRLVEPLLFGVKGFDLASLAAAALFLWLAIAMACAIPARRAIHSAPAESLRAI